MVDRQAAFGDTCMIVRCLFGSFTAEIVVLADDMPFSKKKQACSEDHQQVDSIKSWKAYPVCRSTQTA